MSFVCGEPAVKLLYRTRTKRDCTSAQCIFNWNASLTGHREGTVGFPQRKWLLRSTANCSVSNSNTELEKV